MKQVIVLLLFCACTLYNYAQKPEPVYSFAREPKSLEWYKEQLKAWRNVVEKEPENGHAWWYLYRLHRNLLKCDTTDKRSKVERVSEVDKFLLEMEKAVPDSYDYNLARWAHSGQDMKYYQNLMKADALGKDRWEHCEDMINIGIRENKREQIDFYCQKLYNSGNVSSGLLNYNYNVLNSIEANGIIFTAGDNDTYPLLVLQSLGIRRDVTVINLYLFYINEYRNTITKQLGLANWDNGVDFSEESQKNYNEGIIQYIASNKKSIPVYCALTVSDLHLSKIQSDLYMIGMAYLYSKRSIDNMAMMKHNFEQVYRLDYISNAFYPDIAKEIVAHINCNYVVPMIKLYEHYKILGDVKNQEKMKSLAMIIAKETDNVEEVSERFK